MAQDSNTTHAGETDGHNHEGQHEFRFTYDDTGAVQVVVAPNGWTMNAVITKAYEELKEAVQQDDRVEFGTTVLTPELRALRVKEFVDRGYARDGKLHIVSKPGGALERI